MFHSHKVNSLEFACNRNKSLDEPSLPISFLYPQKKEQIRLELFFTKRNAILMRLKKGSLSNCIEFSIVEDVTMTGKIASSNETFFLQCIFYSRNVMDLCSNNIPYTQKYFIHFISITFYFCNTFRCYKLYPLALSETRKSHKSDYLPYIKM